jgi:uncharacterized protein YdiU (UPF0061 family)
MRAKCGLTACAHADPEADRALLEALLDVMADSGADFTLTFYHLSRLGDERSGQDRALRELFADDAQIDSWLDKWRQRLGIEPQGEAARQESMQAVNPVYIPRNHQVEAAIRAAEDRGDFSPFHELHAVLQNPCAEQQGRDSYRQAPEPEERVEVTFCGT